MTTLSHIIIKWTINSANTAASIAVWSRMPTLKSLALPMPNISTAPVAVWSRMPALKSLASPVPNRNAFDWENGILCSSEIESN